MISVELKVEEKKLTASDFEIADHLRGVGQLAKSERYALWSELVPKFDSDPECRIALYVAGSDPRGDRNFISKKFDSHYDAVQAYNEFKKLIAEVNGTDGEFNAELS